MLYHEIADGFAHGMGDVKKLSKQSESAADHEQMDSTSSKVYANLADVRQRPSGRPKYSSWRHGTPISNRRRSRKFYGRLTYIVTMT